MFCLTRRAFLLVELCVKVGEIDREASEKEGKDEDWVEQSESYWVEVCSGRCIGRDVRVNAEAQTEREAGKSTHEMTQQKYRCTKTFIDGT